MRKIAFIHTVDWYKTVQDNFIIPFFNKHKDLEPIHIVDSSLLSESLEHGEATPNVYRRILQYAQCAENAGAEIIMCTCTTVNKASSLAREILNIPMFNIDEPMAKFAVAAGKRIGVLATVPTSAPCTERLLYEEAARTGKKIEIETVINEDAFKALLDGDIALHDKLVGQEMDELAKKVDVIALGQISLSSVVHACGKPVFQVGQSAFDELERMVYGQ